MEIQQEFIYDVFWEQQLVSVEACLFLFFFDRLRKNHYWVQRQGKEKKKNKQTKKTTHFKQKVPKVHKKGT